ncbi:hypothetical protein AVEN_112849-2-1, partial [Araneus ventricosus]
RVTQVEVKELSSDRHYFALDALVLESAFGHILSSPWQGLGFGAGGFQARNPIPLKISHVWDLLHVKSYVVAKRPPVGVVWKFGEGSASSGVVLVI